MGGSGLPATGRVSLDNAKWRADRKRRPSDAPQADTALAYDRVSFPQPGLAMPITRAFIGRLLLSLAVCALPAVAATAPTPIRSPADLERHLADAGPQSPLRALSPGARQRFLAALRFGADGIGGFSVEELDDALTAEDILAVLALFELEAYAPAVRPAPERREPREFISAFEQRFDLLHAAAIHRDPAAVLKAYQALLGDSDPATLAPTLDAQDRALLYRAMLKALDAEAPDAVADQAARLLTSMHAAGEATGGQVERLFHAYVKRRMFAAADRFAQRFPEVALPALPRYTPAEAPAAGNAALQVSADGTRMSRVAVDISRGLQIVVVAGCHFARDAAIAIATDPALDQVFREHSTWIAPSDEGLAAAAKWNREFPLRPILIAWSERDWPQITSWAMPTFLLFRDGVLQRSWSGWPADSGLATARAELSAAGIEL